ncbi:MAG: hypothetical protein ACLQJR_34610 [Stellaceae bacterium]
MMLSELDICAQALRVATAEFSAAQTFTAKARRIANRAVRDADAAEVRLARLEGDVQRAQQRFTSARHRAFGSQEICDEPE